MNHDRMRLRAIGMLLLTTLSWGLSFPLMKAWSLAMGSGLAVSTAGMGLRFAVAALLALPLLRSGLPTPREWRQGFWVGFHGAFGMILQADGLQHTLATTSAFLTQFTCVLVPLWLALSQRKRPSWFMLFCLALVMAGVAILSGFDVHSFQIGRGEIETLLSTVFFAAMIFAIEDPTSAGNRPGAVTWVFLLVSAAICLPGLLRVNLTPAFAHPLLVAMLLFLAVASTLLAFLWMIRWQPKVTATEAGILYCAEPVSAALASLFLPLFFSQKLGLEYANEKLTVPLLVGGGLILFANVLIALAPAETPQAVGINPAAPVSSRTPDASSVETDRTA